ncbi:MAG: acyltransferase domain-containing protein, partial [Blastocatellia bacterium]
FSGQGTQRREMGRSLYEGEIVFREAVDTCATLIEAELGLDIREVLYPPVGREQMAEQRLLETRLAQPALFVIEYALAQWLIKLGIRPVGMIGHSLGEYVAACLAGVFTLEEGLRLVVKRGELMQLMPTGAMLAVQANEDEVEAWLGPGLWLAALNGAGQCVVSGTVDAIARLETGLETQGVEYKRLRVQHAFHSGLLDDMLEPYARALRNVKLRPPQLPYVSNVTGQWIRQDEPCDVTYWLRQLREPVRFGQGLHAFANEPSLILLEVGPGDTLCSFARLQARQAAVLPVLGLSRSKAEAHADARCPYRALGEMWVRGVNIVWQGLYEGEQRQRVSLPTYPFERERYWIGEAAQGDARPEQRHERGPVHKRRNVADWFYLPLWKETPLPWMSRTAVTDVDDQTWLVFSSGEKLSQAIAKRIAEGGGETIVVDIGEAFVEASAKRYQINPDREEDYLKLFGTLEQRGQFPSRIVHLWCLEPDPESRESEEAARATDLGFY